MSFRRLPKLLVHVPVLLGLAGCNLIFGIQDGTLDSSGTGGGGGAATSTTTTGAGGAGGGSACGTPSDCAPASECEEATCEAGECGASPLPQGTAIAQQTAGDCKQSECDGAGSVTVVTDDTDVPDDFAECTNDACAGGVPTNTDALVGTPCGTNLALACDGDGQCSGCVNPAQCAGVDDACKTKTCDAASGLCGVSFTNAGALPAAAQVTGNCQTLGCDGFGNLTSANTAADVFDDGNNCTEDLCEGSPLAPTNDPELANTPCGASGLCDGAGACVGCNSAADCGVSTTCRTFTCVSSMCMTTLANAGVPCADGMFCNGAETCNGSGMCGGSAGDPCAANVGDTDADCSEACNEATDSCTANDPPGSSCTDGSFCNGSESCNASGACGGGAGDPCAANLGDADSDCSEACNEATDSCTANDPPGSSCTDGSFCNGSEMCSGSGMCAGSTGNPCPVDGDGDCMDGCNEAADNCTANSPTGSPCPNANYCDGVEACSGGSCLDGADPCPGTNQPPSCSDSCNEAADNCMGNDISGTPCPDASFCNGPERCTGSGVCTDGPAPCPGQNQGPNCGDSCNEVADDCTAPDIMGTTCRPAVFGGCDLAESCDGTQTSCPIDDVEPNGTFCAPADPNFPCDTPDFCNGFASNCPDSVAPSVSICRPAQPGGCDISDFCDGMAKACPMDAVEMNGVVCRAEASACDLQEVCDGSAPVCPSDATECQGGGCFSTIEVQQTGFGLDPAKPQFTRCESVYASGGNVTCVNPTVRYGTADGGVPVDYTTNDFTTWCQQLGCLDYVANSAAYGPRDCSAPGGKVYWFQGGDDPAFHWSDWADNLWFDATLDKHDECDQAIVSITCSPPQSDGTVVDVFGSSYPIRIVRCGDGTDTNCTQAVAEASCAAVGKRLVSHASSGSAGVVSLGATNSCSYSISYFVKTTPTPAGHCLVGVSNADWGGCCGTNAWHGHTVDIPTTAGQQFGFVDPIDSGYTSTMSNVSGTFWGCVDEALPAGAHTGCTTYDVACL